MSDFTDLLFEAEKLSNEIEGTSELPKVDRSLRQVLEASNELYTRVAQTGSKDIQANLLLGSKGIDLPRISQKLDLISTKRTFEPVEVTDDIDLDVFLKSELQNCILSLVEDEHEKCFDRIQDELWQHQLAEWRIEKRKLLHAMTAPSGGFIDISKHKCMGVEPPPLGTSILDKQEALYAVKVMEYNLAVARGMQKQNLIHVFGAAAEQYKDSKVIEMWEIMKYMTDLPPFPRTEDAIKVRYCQPVIKALVKQGKKYLEDRYKTYMTNVINENLVLAQRGGIPGTYPLVRSFVGIRLQGEYLGLEDGLIEDRPLWPMVYYCLRSGDISAALHCLKKSNVECSELQQILEVKLNNPDSAEIARLESSIKFTYRRCIRNATDPFKRIVWAVLGCCDVIDEHSEVAKTVDDYLWLKLSLVRVDYDKDDHIKYEDLQRTVLEEYGESHYDAINQPHLYFQVLALTGQFEVAIEFLVRIHRYRLHGVHIGIALHELYMLGRPVDFTCPLIFIDPADPKPSRRMNIARLIMLYVRKFEISCIEEAVHYFFLLNNLHNIDGVNVYSKCVSDLAQETREYEKLFGKIQKNGIRTKGMLDQFKNPEVPVEKLAQQVAAELKEKALFEDAVDLYDLSNQKSQAVELLCILLSQVVHLPAQDGSLRERLAVKVRELAERYEHEGYDNCDPNEVTSFKSLKDLLLFFDNYHGKQYKEALKILQNMQVIPFFVSEIDERIEVFRRLNGDVAKVMPDVLLATMNILFAQYQSIKGNEYIPKFHDINIDKQLQSVREQASVLTNFTGMLPYRMPGDTNSRLVQMEILMH